ncbi:MAG: acetyl-CoA carboxylase biotin carboxyl carrier protein subunit [Deltaproteobacteria bacterium]|nr:acetyl-CoA carboxylase biotin carboxyl carrier protein subunit [Deltaproteobacteria bacterium]
MKLLKTQNNSFTAQSDQETLEGKYFISKDFVDVHLPSGTYRLPLSNTRSRQRAGMAQSGSLNAPMPGKILKVLAQPGDAVKSGETLLILEAMKMEHKICSPKEGLVKKIYFNEGERVTQGDILCELE